MKYVSIRLSRQPREEKTWRVTDGLTNWWADLHDWRTPVSVSKQVSTTAGGSALVYVHATQVHVNF